MSNVDEYAMHSTDLSLLRTPAVRRDEYVSDYASIILKNRICVTG